MKILTGNSNRPLAEAICAVLNLPLTRASVKRFSVFTPCTVSGWLVRA
jgi:ribose-phosphate pyrophosphokinase